MLNYSVDFSLDPELSPECLTGMASLSPNFTDTVIGLLDFGGDVSTTDYATASSYPAYFF
jgi:hypothetical protein